MKILLISPLPPPAGGIATWTTRYLNSDESKKNQVNLLNTAVQGKRIKELQNKNLFEEIKRTLKILIELNKKLKENPNVVHLNTSCGKFGLIRDYICSEIIKKNKIKLVTQYHCNIEDMINSKISNFFLNSLAKNTTINLVLNKNSKVYLKQISKKDSIIIPNFISEENFEKLSKGRILNKEIKIILYTGHLVKTKGCDEILEVAKKFPKIKFILAGNIKEEYKNIKKSLNVQFLGELDQERVFSELKEADVYLFPTYTEGFPNALLEAMSSGLPIITTRVGAIVDMVQDKGALLVEAGNDEQISNAISDLIQNIEKRKEMSKFNIQKVSEFYLQQTVLNQLFEIYKL
ncbi:glycosyltransferase family 4 protein [Cetobacterium sp.]|uniref:glycosyltransferase family 4 protein n=1 Tax=Cetobacterium sp. TaxID=2071632 RepID=UPI003F393BBD